MAKPLPNEVLKPIARDDWQRFFESFTLKHGGWRVSIDGENGTMPLAEIAARDDGRIVLHLGNDLRHHRIITIDGGDVRIAQSDGVERLHIESTDNHRTNLTFRPQ